METKKIKVIKIPSGNDAKLPKWVREAFVGLEFAVCGIPMPNDIKDGDKNETHYAVGVIGAINKLRENSKEEAAKWLESNCTFDNATTFLLESSVCKIVE